MEILQEKVDKNGRKVYQYIGSDGELGRLVTRKQHLLDLKDQGKLIDIDIKRINFSSKRKRSSSCDSFSTTNPFLQKTCEQLEEINLQPPRHDQPPSDPGGGGIGYHGADEQESAGEVGQHCARGVELVGGERGAGDAQQHIEADGEVHGLLGGDEGMVGGCGQAAVEGGRGNPWVCDQDGGDARLLESSVHDNVQTYDPSNPASSESSQQSSTLGRNTNHLQQRALGVSYTKARNEVERKDKALGALKTVTTISDLKVVCKVLDKFRSEQMPSKIILDEEWRSKMMDILTDEKSSSSEIVKLLSLSKPVRDFFLENIIQETMMCGMNQSFKDFPPVLKENFCLSLIQEVRDSAPNLLSLVVKFCTKLNEPVTEKQVRKIVQLISQLASCLNQKDSALQKLVALKLKLFSITNSGLDFLNDIGLTQSSRSWQKDCDFLASINRDYIVEELQTKSFSFLVDNLDKVIEGNLVHFTSVILVADRKQDSELSEEIPGEQNLFTEDYLKLNDFSQLKYMSAITHILGNMLIKSSCNFHWIRKFIPKEFKHEHSEVANKQTFWSYLALLPLSEQKNADMVEILQYLNEFTLEMLSKTARDPSQVEKLIDIIKGDASSDIDVEEAQAELMKVAQKKGLPSIIGDQLTFERAFVAKELRKGNITMIESFSLMQFRMAMFHELMAKLSKDFSTFLPSLSNSLDRGNLAHFRARLSRHDISNDESKIKKGEEKRFN